MRGRGEQRDRSEKSLIKTPLKYGRRVRIKVLVFLARVCALSGTAVYVMFCGTRGAGRWWWGGRGVITPGCEELWSRAPNREGVFSVALGEFFTRRARLAVHVDWTGGCQCAGPAHSALTIDRATAAKRSFRRERAALLIPLAGDSACPPHHTPTHLFFNKSIFKTFRGAVPRPTIVYIVFYNSCMSPFKYGYLMAVDG